MRIQTMKAEIKKYSFSMTKKEILNFSVNAVLKHNHIKLALLFGVLAIIFSKSLVLRWLGIFFAVFIIGLIFVRICRSYSLNKKNLYGKTQTMWLENGLLKIDGEEYSEVACNDIQYYEHTWNLLMFGVYQENKRLTWYALPHRVFSEGQEYEDFQYIVENQPPYMYNVDITSVEDEESELFYFSFRISKGKWRKILMDFAEIDHSGVLGDVKKSKVIWAILGMNLAVFVYGYIFYYNMILLSINYLVLFCLIMSIKSAKGNPEKRIKWALKHERKHLPDEVYGLEELYKAIILRKGIFPYEVYGAWEISITETGVMWYGPQSGLSYGAWDKFSCMVETDNAFYLFFTDKKHFIMILKECIGSYEQEEALKRLCMEKNIAVIMGKKVKYVPDWVFNLLIAALIVMFMLCIILNY